MDDSKRVEKQRTLAQRASQDSSYRFYNLYSLLHWEYWIQCAAQTVLSRPGSHTAGVDNATKSRFLDSYDRQISTIVDQLKKRIYKPLPVRRAYIPKAKGKKRPLGIPTVAS